MRAEYENNGHCRVLDDGGEVVSEFDTVCEPGFSGQYGTPFSPDGTRLFIGTWKRGLFGYDVSSGRVLWRQGPGKVEMILVFNDFVISQMADRGIYQWDIATGQLVQQFKMTAIEFMIPLGEHEVFTGPKRKNYFVLHVPGLEVLHTIPGRRLDVNSCLSFIINDCRWEGDRLRFLGWEQYPHMEYVEGAEAVEFDRLVKP